MGCTASTEQDVVGVPNKYAAARSVRAQKNIVLVARVLGKERIITVAVKAAIKLQARLRGIRARKEFAEKKGAAIMCQAAARGKIARDVVRGEKSSERNEEPQLAVVLTDDKRPVVHVKEVFNKLDTNKDGLLSLEEAKVALTGRVPQSEHAAVFKTYDADSSGFLDLSEFIKLYRDLDAARYAGRSVIDHAAVDLGLAPPPSIKTALEATPVEVKVDQGRQCLMM